MSKLENRALDPQNFNAISADVAFGSLHGYGGFFDLIWTEIFPGKANIALVWRKELEDRLVFWMHGNARDVAYMLENRSGKEAREIGFVLSSMMNAYDRLTEIPAEITHILFEDRGLTNGEQ